MKSMRIIRVAITFAATLAALSNSHVAAADRPNVIVVLSDDQGYGDFSIHGNPLLKTPNLDALARQSVRLTDFHVAPMCTPTRGQLMSGVDACRSGATSVCAGRSFLRPGIPTMADIFTAAGYQTAIFGKWHLGDSYPNLPFQKGFGESVYHLGWGITSIGDLWENDYFDGRFRHNGQLEKYPGYCTDVWFNLSLDWIRQRAAASEPFLLYLPTNAPHGPHWVPDKYKQLYPNAGPARNFFGMIANLDENVGRLTAALDELKLTDNTILVFFNDNGGTAGVNIFNSGMRGRKTQYYEGGHRAACFIRYPNGKLASRDISELTQVQDLLPTLIDLCGVTKPEKAKFDGSSLVGLLKGSVATPDLTDRKLVVQYGQKPEKYDSAVMWQKWRLVKGSELYDLKTDPGQQTDVAAQHPEIAKSLREHYDQWWSGVEPLLASPVPVVIGADQENPVRLTAADWWNVYCDNARDVRLAKEVNSNWTVEVAKDGNYEIALRRWPREADAPLTASLPAFKGVDGELPAGVALPIAKIRLKAGDYFEGTKAVEPTDKEITFTVPLRGGTKLPLQSFCYDATGKELCGAYFAYVTRK